MGRQPHGRSPIDASLVKLLRRPALLRMLIENKSQIAGIQCPVLAPLHPTMHVRAVHEVQHLVWATVAWR